MTNERMKEVKDNVTAKVIELVADNVDMREAFFRNEKAFEAYVLQAVTAVICTRAVERDVVNDMDGVNVGKIVDFLLPELFTKKELADYFKTIILKVSNEDIPLCVSTIALMLFGVMENCHKDMPILSKIIYEQFEALCEVSDEEEEMIEFDRDEYHELMDALLDKKSDIGAALRKLNDDFCRVCINIGESFEKRKLFEFEGFEEYISTAEFLAAFLPRFFSNKEINKYIVDMTDKILDEDEFADEGDIARYLFGKVNDVEIYMYDYARMIDDAYEEAIIKKYGED